LKKNIHFHKITKSIQVTPNSVGLIIITEGKREENDCLEKKKSDFYVSEKALPLSA